jgi:hypothetical protein
MVFNCCAGDAFRVAAGSCFIIRADTATCFSVHKSMHIRSAPDVMYSTLCCSEGLEANPRLGAWIFQETLLSDLWMEVLREFNNQFAEGMTESFRWKNPEGYSLRKLQRLRNAMPRNIGNERGRGADVWMAEMMMLAFNLQRRQPPLRIPTLWRGSAGDHRRSMFSTYLKGVVGPTMNQLEVWLTGTNWRGKTQEVPDPVVVPELVPEEDGIEVPPTPVPEPPEVQQAQQVWLQWCQEQLQQQQEQQQQQQQQQEQQQTPQQQADQQEEGQQQQPQQQPGQQQQQQQQQPGQQQDEQQQPQFEQEQEQHDQPQPQEPEGHDIEPDLGPDQQPQEPPEPEQQEQRHQAAQEGQQEQEPQQSAQAGQQQQELQPAGQVDSEATHTAVNGGGAGPAAGDEEPLEEPLAWTRAPRRVPRSRGGTASRVLADEEPEVPMDVDSEVRGALDALRELGGSSPAPRSRARKGAAGRAGGSRAGGKRKRETAATKETPAKKAATAVGDTGLVKAVFVHGKPIAVPVRAVVGTDEELTTPRRTSPGPGPSGAGGEISPLGSTGMHSPTSRRSSRKAAVRAKSKIAATAQKEAEEEPPTDYLTDSEDEGRDRSGGPPLGPPLGRPLGQPLGRPLPEGEEGATAGSEAGTSDSSDEDADGGDVPEGTPATAQGTGRQHGPVPPINKKTTIFRVWYEISTPMRNYEFTHRYIERRDTRQTSVTLLTRKYRNKVIFDDAPKKLVSGTYTVETMPEGLLEEFFEDQGEPGYEGDVSAEGAPPLVPIECSFQEPWDYRVHVGDERLAGGMVKRYRTILRTNGQKTSKTLLCVLLNGNLIGGTKYEGKMGFRYYQGELPEDERREFLSGIGELAPGAPAHTTGPSGSGVQGVGPAAVVVQSNVPGFSSWDYRVDTCSLRLSLTEVKRYRYITRKADNAVSRVMLAHIMDGNKVAGPGYDGKDGTIYYVNDLPGGLKGGVSEGGA